MLPGRSKLLLLLSLVACGEKTPPEGTGIALTVAYDSTMTVDRLVVWGTTDLGATRIEQRTLDAPFSLDPPGLRMAPLELMLRDPSPGETVVVRVDGRAADGRVVGSGATAVTIELDRRIPAQVTLGAPTVCGDGRTSHLEACDDGNTVAGDGCSDLCTVEPGRCGDNIAAGGEQCDDGNTADGDGCSSTCTLEVLGELMFEVERIDTATTSSPDFVDVPDATLTFTPNSTTERWLIFVSGVMGSSDPAELSAELRLIVNGVEVDHFGHQTLGAVDNEAGFVTFETLTGVSGPQEIRPQFRALAGVTRLKQLRVVAALIPPGADFQYAASDGVLETAGANLELAQLAFTPSRPGDYVVLAKSNVTEEPSNSTARVWLEDDRGLQHPTDGFSSPRDAWVPAFVALSRPLDASPKRFVVRGSSSATGNIADWWNEAFNMRQVVVITAPDTGLPAGYAVQVTFDHAAQVAAGRARADGSDVWVVARTANGTLAPIDRVVDESSGWNRSDTRIWFATVEGVTPEYWIYWGSTTPEHAPSNPDNVFPFFDRFDGAALDPARWAAQRSSGTVQNGQLILGPQQAVLSAEGRAYGADSIWEAQVTIGAMSPLFGQLGIWTASQPADMGTGIGFLGFGEGLVAQAGQSQNLVRVDNPLATHVLGFVRRGDTQVDFLLDGQPALTLQALVPGDLRPYMFNQDQSATITYDWVRVRSALPQEPAISLGNIEGRTGALPSRFSYAKLIAFRSDVFARAFHVSSPDTVTTAQAEPAPLAELEVPAPAAEIDELVIASARISGASSGTGRKSGEIRADGELLVGTSHRIDRDSTRQNGYHHVVGVVDARRTRDVAKYQIDIASPDGIRVDGASPSIIVLSYPAR